MVLAMAIRNRISLAKENEETCPRCQPLCGGSNEDTTVRGNPKGLALSERSLTDLSVAFHERPQRGWPDCDRPLGRIPKTGARRSAISTWCTARRRRYGRVGEELNLGRSTHLRNERFVAMN